MSLKPGDPNALRGRGDIQALQALVPGKPTADETGVRGNLRAIAVAQFTYAGTCGGGHYAPTFAIFSRPAPGQKSGFLADLAPVGAATVFGKHRYRIEMIAAPSLASPAGCNAVARGGLAATFSVVARPLAGFQGRVFRIDADGTLTDIK